MTTYHVTGSAEATHAPELAQIVFNVGASGPSAEDVATVALREHNKLAERLTSLAAADDSIEVQVNAPSSYVIERWVSDEDGHVLHYVTNSRLKLTLSNFVQLGGLLGDYLGDDYVKVSVEWKLTSETIENLKRRVRQAALANARELAEDYAAGDPTTINAALVLLSVTDENSVRRPVLARAGAMKASAAERPHLSPEDITISASVNAIFKTYEPGDN